MRGSLWAVSRARPPRLVFAGLVALVALNLFGLYRDRQARHIEARNASMVQAASEGMVNLTTIDHRQVDQDVQRILDSSTGTFREDFAKNTQSFVDAAKKAQSTSVGTVSEAGLETAGGDEGRVLVALTVMTSNRGVPENQPRTWRTRVTVTDVGGDFKVAAVEFIR